MSKAVAEIAKAGLVYCDKISGYEPEQTFKICFKTNDRGLVGDEGPNARP
jgi:hypothetical protein